MYLIQFQDILFTIVYHYSAVLRIVFKQKFNFQTFFMCIRHVTHPRKRKEKIKNKKAALMDIWADYYTFDFWSLKCFTENWDIKQILRFYDLKVCSW